MPPHLHTGCCAFLSSNVNPPSPKPLKIVVILEWPLPLGILQLYKRQGSIHVLSCGVHCRQQKLRWLSCKRASKRMQRQRTRQPPPTGMAAQPLLLILYSHISAGVQANCKAAFPRALQTAAALVSRSFEIGSCIHELANLVGVARHGHAVLFCGMYNNPYFAEYLTGNLFGLHRQQVESLSQAAAAAQSAAATAQAELATAKTELQGEKWVTCVLHLWLSGMLHDGFRCMPGMVGNEQWHKIAVIVSPC